MDVFVFIVSVVMALIILNIKQQNKMSSKEKRRKAQNYFDNEERVQRSSNTSYNSVEHTRYKGVDESGSSAGLLRLDGMDGEQISEVLSEYDNRYNCLTLQEVREIAVSRYCDYFTEIGFEVKGLEHRGFSALSEAKLLKRNEPVSLVPEPDNPYDKNAVKVVSQNGTHLGYAPARFCEALNNTMQNAIDSYVRLVKRYKDKLYIKVVVHVSGFVEPLREDDDNYILPFRVNEKDHKAQKLKADGAFMEAAQEFLSLVEQSNDKTEQVKFLHQCCICYRKAKAYERELDIVRRIQRDYRKTLSAAKMDEYNKREATVLRFMAPKK